MKKHLTLKLDSLDFMILYGLLIVEQARSEDCTNTSDEIREAQNELVKQLESLQSPEQVKTYLEVILDKEN
jgi:adenylate kinase